MAKQRRIEITQHYQGIATGGRTIQSGVYDYGDPALLGMEDTLLEKGFAKDYDPDALPQEVRPVSIVVSNEARIVPDGKIQNLDRPGTGAYDRMPDVGVHVEAGYMIQHGIVAPPPNVEGTVLPENQQVAAPPLATNPPNTQVELQLEAQDNREAIEEIVNESGEVTKKPEPLQGKRVR